MQTEKLQALLTETGADALLIECDFLRRYLTDFYSTDGYVVIRGGKCTFVADPRYFEAAERVLRGTETEVTEGSYREAFGLLAGVKALGVPFPFVPLARAEQLKSEGFSLVNCMPALKAAMLIKTEEEISRIQRASEIAEDAFLQLLPALKEGMTESETAALLEYNMRRLGASGVSFETICAFGENGSIPHYETGTRKLRFGDPVLIDFGCKFDGYCSDITRTFLFGDDGKHEEFKRLHGIILAAHELVKEKVCTGMTGKEADEVARGHLRQYDLAQYFTHSLGHGIGLQIHEHPVLSPRGEEVLQDGMVFSDEPGIYLAGKLGIRIEDSCYLKDGRVVSFMNKTDRGALIL